MHRGRTRSSGSNGLLFILAFHAFDQYAGRDRRPPVTASLILVNVFFYLQPGRLETINDVCLDPHSIIEDWNFKRFFLSAFYHLDEIHLVSNMLTLLWKGIQLEGQMGSVKFAEMVAVLLGLSHGLVVIFAKGLNMVFDYPDALYNHCAVGFSAVLFALMVVLNWGSPNFTDVYGVYVPARYAAWAELVLIQMFFPKASFLGHLCGIIAGLLYVHNSRWLTLSGIFTLLSRQLIRYLGRSRIDNRADRQRYHRSSENTRAVWRCQMCTYDNPISEDSCEMCGTSRMSHGNSYPSASPIDAMHDTHVASAEPSIDEMRRARLARFSR